MNEMSTILVWSVALGLLQIVLTVLAAVSQRGLKWAVGPRDQGGPLSGVGGRLQRASANFMETFPMFAAVALAAMVLNHADARAMLGAQVYFWARVAYLPIYAAGVPWLRTLVWLTSVVGIIMVALTLL